MKKLATLVVIGLLVFLSSFKGTDSSLKAVIEESETIKVETYELDGIQYEIFTYKGGIDVVNHTKERLEIQLLRKQLKNVE